MAALKDEIEQIKANIRTKVEHLLQVVMRQFGYTKVKFRGPAKNTSQPTTLFEPTNLQLARRKLMKIVA